MKNVELPERLAKAFRNEHYLAINKARMDHLESLNINWKDKSFLELGAGIGDFTEWLTEHGAIVTAIDGRRENVDYLLQLGYDAYWLDLNERHEFRFELRERFDIAFCYGLLYHLTRPWNLLRSLYCIPTLLLETRIAETFHDEYEPNDDPSQSITGHAFIPTRDMLWGALSISWQDVGIPIPLPLHDEYKKEQRIVFRAQGEIYQ